MITHAPQDRSAQDDVRLAAALAAGAGEVLMRLRAEVDGGRRSGDPADLRRAGDAEAQAWLAAALAEARPGDAVLSEEAADDPRRLLADRVWIVDPLDGTREFAERADDGAWREDFAVHVALWQRGLGLTDGAVALPARALVHEGHLPGQAAARPGGAMARTREATVRAVLDGRRPLRVAVSRTRPPVVARWLAEQGAELVPMGSCGFKAASVLDGTVDAYVHAGGQHEWDSAAPVTVALAAGFVATRLDGSPLEYNKPEPWSPDLVICHPVVEARLRAMLASAPADDGRGAGA